MTRLTCWLAVALCLLLPAAASAQRGARIDVTRLGPQVGQAAPSFTLPDQAGRRRTLEGLAGDTGLMLVFSRSVDWCPYCKTQMVELQARLPELRARGLNVAVITYDPPAVLADFARRRGITFPLLSDAGSATIGAYGILNTTVERTSNTYGIPFPGTFLLDRAGRVTARFFEDAFQERNTVSNILVKLGDAEAPRAATRTATDHLTVTSWASDDTVAPGTLFSLVFDITPRRGMHVYAPGDHTYRVIGVKLDPNPLLVVRPMTYPPSEVYVFEPLNERVAVYQKPFRLVQELALSTSQAAAADVARLSSLTLSGTLDYQACDDRICFVPKSVPVTFTVAVRPLDRERSGAAR